MIHCNSVTIERKGDEALEQGADTVSKRADLVLEQTRLQPEEEVQLLDQLEALYPVLAAPEVLPLVADRGGPETLAELVTARNDLTVLVNARSDRATDPATADARDITDGYVVPLTRRARAAANVAARRLGQPAIAEDFRLTHLRPRYGSGATTPDEPGDDEPTIEPTEPTAPEGGQSGEQDRAVRVCPRAGIASAIMTTRPSSPAQAFGSRPYLATSAHPLNHPAQYLGLSLPGDIDAGPAARK
jgi:hypothetical protein